MMESGRKLKGPGISGDLAAVLAGGGTALYNGGAEGPSVLATLLGYHGGNYLHELMGRVNQAARPVTALKSATIPGVFSSPQTALETVPGLLHAWYGQPIPKQRIP
jgi:hypothetical protein